MPSTLSVSLYLLVCWVLMTLVAFFVPWLSLPDLTVVASLYLLYLLPKLPIWRCVLPISLLMDLSAQVCFGFHGLLYTLMALFILPVRTYWQACSSFEQIIGLIVLSVVFQVIRFLLLYITAGISAPTGWFYSILAQIVIYPFIRGLTLWFASKYTPRKNG